VCAVEKKLKRRLAEVQERFKKKKKKKKKKQKQTSIVAP
jgi:hypothetical protein